MKKREQYKRLIMFAASVLIVAVQTGVFAYAWFHNYHTNSVIGRRYSFWGHWAILGIYAFLVVIVSKLFSAFKVGYQRVLDVLLSQIFSVLIVNAVAYIELALIGRWKFLQHVQPMLCVCAVNLALVILWVLFMRMIYVRIYPPNSMLLIYGQYNPASLIKKLEKRRDRYAVNKVISLDSGEEAIEQEILKHQAVMICDIPSHERNIFLKFCFENDIRCYCQPKISDIMIMSSEEINMFDTPLLLFRNRGLTVEQQAVKRIFDVLVSSVALVILSPVFLIIAILIKACDRGPVFYRQERLTKDGKIFMLCKFRSMRVDSEKEGARLAMKADSRVTPVGKVLRDIHFDELPQLINVIRGDMSLVGPRPERPGIAAEYEKKIPEFSYRLKVKAGLTGYAQVYGKYNTEPYDKLKLDLTYIENYSFMMDLQLIATTVKILFQKENTEGVEQWQTTALSKDPLMETADDSKHGQQESVFVSVVIPAYRCALTICRAIDSALAQDVPLEILVINDCSDDDLDLVMEKYKNDDRIRYIKNKSRLGAAASRNLGVQMAKGKYVAFLDADDWWAEDKLKKQLKLMENSVLEVFDENVPVLCATGREMATPDGELTGMTIGVHEYISYGRLLLHNCINCSSVLVRTSAAKEFPMEHEDSHEDYITWMRMLKKYGYAVAVNEPLLKYRLSTAGKSGDKLRSAKMTYSAYRYAGFGHVSSAVLFCSYALNGIIKYARARRAGKTG